MDIITYIPITLGVILLFGLATKAIGAHTKLPRVTLLLLFGIIIGPNVLDIWPEFVDETWFAVITNMALTLIGFLLGGNLNFSIRDKLGQTVLWISISEVIITVILVLAGLLLIGIPPEIALIFAGIAPSTAPAATTDVVHEMRSEGNFTRALLGIVALDDALGIIVFTIMIAVAQGMNNHDFNMAVILTGAWELAGAFLIGFALGFPLCFLARRLDQGEPMLMVALGTLFLCNGLSALLGVSLPLAAMVLGAVVANFAREHPGPLMAIYKVKLPFLVLFFVMAGASLHIKSLAEIEILGASYILLRATGRIVGAWPGAAIADSGPEVKKWMGMALMPQAGLALGLALFATEQFPEIRDTILPVVIGTTVIFELVGPLLTRTALVRAGEVPEK